MGKQQNQATAPTGNGTKAAYTFSEEELETIQATFAQMDQTQSNLNFYLNHVIRARKLPQIEGGYTLTQDRRGLIPRSEAPQFGG
jgi:hypothetical protein